MRFLAFCLLILLALMTPYWSFLIGATLYALWQKGFELIFLGMFIDAQFGTATVTFPYLYTVSAGLLVASLELIKPTLSFYDA